MTGGIVCRSLGSMTCARNDDEFCTIESMRMWRRDSGVDAIMLGSTDYVAAYCITCDLVWIHVPCLKTGWEQ